MYQDRERSSHQLEYWNNFSPLKIGALSLVSSALFDANAIYHFHENGIFSVQGAMGLVLGEISLKTASAALKEFRNIEHSSNSIDPTNYDNL